MTESRTLEHLTEFNFPFSKRNAYCPLTNTEIKKKKHWELRALKCTDIFWYNWHLQSWKRGMGNKALHRTQNMIFVWWSQLHGLPPSPVHRFKMKEWHLFMFREKLWQKMFQCCLLFHQWSMCHKTTQWIQRWDESGGIVTTDYETQKIL